ncbi:hypothetical protein ACWCPT_09235 [Streptomyces sp. NPDC002308]
MAYEKILIDEIDASRPIRALPSDMGRMINSLHRNGLRQPLIVSHSDKLLVSGFSRLAACRTLGWKRLRVFMVRNAEEAARALGDHVSNPDPEFACPMDATARFELSLRICALGKPVNSSSTYKKIDYNQLTSSFTALPFRVAKCLRFTHNRILKAEEQGNSGELELARKYLTLMLQACDDPPAGKSTTGAVEFLLSMMRSGADPDRLTRGAPTTSNPIPRPSKPSGSKGTKSIRLGVESISGALEGLETLIWSNGFPENAEYLNSEFNRQVKTIRNIQQKISRSNDGTNHS